MAQYIFIDSELPTNISVLNLRNELRVLDSGLYIYLNPTTNTNPRNLIVDNVTNGVTRSQLLSVISDHIALEDDSVISNSIDNHPVFLKSIYSNRIIYIRSPFVYLNVDNYYYDGSNESEISKIEFGFNMTHSSIYSDYTPKEIKLKIEDITNNNIIYEKTNIDFDGFKVFTIMPEDLNNIPTGKSYLDFKVSANPKNQSHYATFIYHFFKLYLK